MRAFYLGGKFEKSIRIRNSPEFERYANKIIAFGGNLIVDNLKIKIFSNGKEILSLDPQWDNPTSIYESLDIAVEQLKNNSKKD